MKRYTNYKITNLINGKVYIGYHYGDPNDNYFGSASTYNKLWDDIRKYERDCYGLTREEIRDYYAKNRLVNFTREIIQYYDDEESMKSGEEYWIDFYRNLIGWENVYNISDGNDGGWSNVNNLRITDPDRFHEITRKNRELTSIRMRENNPMKDPEVARRQHESIRNSGYYDNMDISHLVTREANSNRCNTNLKLYGSKNGNVNSEQGIANRNNTCTVRYGGPMGQCHTAEVNEKINKRLVFVDADHPNNYVVMRRCNATRSKINWIYVCDYDDATDEIKLLVHNNEYTRIEYNKSVINKMTEELINPDKYFIYENTNTGKLYIKRPSSVRGSNYKRLYRLSDVSSDILYKLIN